MRCFEVGDRVVVTEGGGAFAGYEGVVEEVMAARGVARVGLVIFGRATPIEVEAKWLDWVDGDLPGEELERRAGG